MPPSESSVDDLILIPAGIAVAMKAIPPSVLAECRAQAQQTLQNEVPVGRSAGVVVVLIRLAVAAVCIVWAYGAIEAQLWQTPWRQPR